MALPAAASVLSSGLAAYPTIYYDRVALDTLHSHLVLYPGVEKKQMPDRSGVAMQIFNFTAFGANTTAATEGTPGAGQTLTQNTGTINLSNYVDYVSFSNKVVLTFISDIVAEGAAELAFRGAITVDTVIATTLDVYANGNSAARIDVNDGTYFTASLSRQAGMKLRALNVKPKPNGKFYGAMPSLVAYDLTNDSAAGGLIDLTKYAETLAMRNIEGVDPVSFHIGEVSGVDWFESNALPVETNWQSSAHNGYHCYVLGLNSVVGASLGQTQLGEKNFSVKVAKFDQPIAVDPANQIAAAAAYNFFWGCVTSIDSARFKRVRVESSIG